MQAQDSFAAALRASAQQTRTCFVCEQNHASPVSPMHRCARCGQCFCMYHTSSLASRTHTVIHDTVKYDGIDFSISYRLYSSCPLCDINRDTETIAIDKVNHMYAYNSRGFIELLGEYAPLMTVATRSLINSITARANATQPDRVQSAEYVDPFTRAPVMPVQTADLTSDAAISKKQRCGRDDAKMSHLQ